MQDQREGRAWDWQKPGDFREASQMALVVKNLPTNAGDLRDAGSILGSVHGIFQGRVLEWGAIAFSV